MKKSIRNLYLGASPVELHFGVRANSRKKCFSLISNNLVLDHKKIISIQAKQGYTSVNISPVILPEYDIVCPVDVDPMAIHLTEYSVKVPILGMIPREQLVTIDKKLTIKSKETGKNYSISRFLVSPDSVHVVYSSLLCNSITVLERARREENLRVTLRDIHHNPIDLVTEEVQYKELLPDVKVDYEYLRGLYLALEKKRRIAYVDEYYFLSSEENKKLRDEFGF